MAPISGASEKRKHPRLEKEHNIALKILPKDAPAPTKEHMFFHVAQDISLGGLRFSTALNLAIDTNLQVHMAIQEPLMAITRTAVIRWVKSLPDGNGHSVGIEFVNTSDADARVWTDYVRLRGNG